MRATRFCVSLFVLSMVVTAPIGGARSVPFKGTWTGETVSADMGRLPYRLSGETAHGLIQWQTVTGAGKITPTIGADQKQGRGINGSVILRRTRYNRGQIFTTESPP